MRDAAFAMIWLVLLPACFLSPHVGVLLWIWVALLSPNEMLFGIMSGVPLNKVVAIVTLAIIIAKVDRKTLYFDTTLGLLVALALTGTVSWLTGLVSTPYTDDLYLKLIKEIVLAFAIAMVMTTRSRIHLVAFIVAIAIGFIGVKEGLIFVLTAGGHKILGNGAIGDNNSLATALLMTAPIMYYLYRYSQLYYVRMAMIAALVLTIISVIATFSRGGFIGLVVLGLFTVKNSRNKAGGFAMVAAAAIIIYFAAPDTWFNRLSTIDNAGSDGSFMGRVVAWKVSWLIAMDHPLFGGGPHAVQQWVVWNSYTPRLSELDFIPTPPFDNYPHAAHSVWFEILGDLGFVGLGVFCSLLGAAFWNCRRIYLLSRNEPDLHWATDLARMLQISLVTYVVTATALSMGYFEMLYILVALISRIRHVVETSLAQRAHAPIRIAAAPLRGRALALR